MVGRRLLYLVLLVWAALLHFAYGQYITHYLLIFLLCAPILSVLLSLPAALRSRVMIIRGSDVYRGRETSVTLSFDTFGLLPPEAWKATVTSENLFTGTKFPKQKVRVYGSKRYEKEFSPDTSEIGCIRFKIKRAFVYDYLGLIPIPVKNCGSVDVTVLPDKRQPVPEPELIARSSMALKPKPQGFAEEHELRHYREGDPLNLIHWKLTAKYDEVIIREPQEEVRKPIVLVLDVPVLYMDHLSVLEQLSYIHSLLQSSNIPYSINYSTKQVHISSENDYLEFIKGVLSEPMRIEKELVVFKTTEDELVYRIRPGKGAFV